jgi:hypothetical protein
MTSREGQVRPEFQLWFPRLAPDTWYPAVQLRSHVSDQLRGGEPRWSPRDRIPSDEHFIFRGGQPRGRGYRTRESDRHVGRP